MRKYFGNWTFYKMVLAVAIPMMLQNLVTTSVNLVDSLMVGQLGDYAIGGVAAVNRFYLIGSYGTMGVAAASGIFIAQYFGANNHQKMMESFRFSIVASYVIILPMFFIAFFFPQYILGFFTQDVEIIQIGVQYLKIACFSFLPIGFSLSMSSALRCIGETKIPLYVSVFSVLTNTLFNYILIFGHFGFPCLGVSGAAIATLLARCLELMILALILKEILFLLKPNSKISLKYLRD